NVSGRDSRLRFGAYQLMLPLNTKEGNRKKRARTRRRQVHLPLKLSRDPRGCAENREGDTCIRRHIRYARWLPAKYLHATLFENIAEISVEPAAEGAPPPPICPWQRRRGRRTVPCAPFSAGRREEGGSQRAHYARFYRRGDAEPRPPALFPGSKR